MPPPQRWRHFSFVGRQTSSQTFLSPARSQKTLFIFPKNHLSSCQCPAPVSMGRTLILLTPTGYSPQEDQDTLSQNVPFWPVDDFQATGNQHRWYERSTSLTLSFCQGNSRVSGEGPWGERVPRTPVRGGGPGCRLHDKPH